MTISIVANGGGIVSLNGTSTLSLTLGSGSNRVAFVLAGCANDTTSVLNTATLGGGSLTVPTAMTINGRRVYPFLLNLSLTGAQTFQANWSQAQNHFIAYAVFQGTGTLSFGTPAQTSATWTDQPSVDITDSAVGDLIALLMQENNGRALTPGAGDSHLGTFTGAASSFRYGLRTDGAAGTVNISGTFSGGASNTLGVAVAIKEAAAPAQLGGNVDLDAVAPDGGLSSSPSALGGNVDLDPVLPAGTLGAQPGTVTIPALRNGNTGLYAGATVPVVVFLRLDGTTALVLANQVTNGVSGNLVATNAALVQGQTYVAVGFNADASLIFRRRVVAA